MHVFHYINPDYHTAHIFFWIAGSIGAVLFAAVIITAIVLQVRKSKYTDYLLLPVFVTFFILAIGIGVPGGSLIGNAQASAAQKTQENLTIWVNTNYSAHLVDSSAAKLLKGHAVVISYNGKPTVVQLLDYNNGYVLVDSTNQVPLAQEGK